MEQISSMVSNGGGSVTMQRDDDYRKRIMHSEYEYLYTLQNTLAHIHTSQKKTITENEK